MAYKFTFITLPALCVTLLVPLLAQSQEAGSTASRTERQEAALEEIVVTARRRDESLQDVPISIVVRSGDFLDRSQVGSLTELDRVVPGFVFNNFEGGGQSTMGIRGLSTFSNEMHVSHSVSIVVDDVVLGNIGQGVTEFNDIERVEVLRGPQGTLFGRNTSGGVVHIVTNDPATDEFESKFSAGYGSYSEVKWNGTVSGPVTENLSARASIFTKNQEGYIENINDGQMLGADEQIGVRTKFLYTPREGTRLRLTATYIEREQDGRVNPVVNFGPFASETSQEVNAEIAGPRNDKVNGFGFHPFEDQVAGASLVWDQGIGEYNLTSITAFEYWEWFFSEDKPFRTFYTGSRLAEERFFLSAEARGWSQELRLTSPAGRKLEYVVGTFVTGREVTENRHFLFRVASGDSPSDDIFARERVVQDSEPFNYAAFGEADLHLTDTLTLTAGARWTHDEVDVTVDSEPVPGYIPEFGIGFDSQGRLFVPILTSEAPGIRKESTSANEWSWRAGLRWAPKDDRMFYSTVARGFKGPTITALGAVLSPVAPEIATNYEVGMKAGFLDNRVRTSLSLFHTDVDDFQAEGAEFVSTPEGTITNFMLLNAAKVRSRGVELELSVVPTDRLSFDLGVAFVDAKYESFPDTVCFPSQTLEQGCVTPPGSPGGGLQDLTDERLPLTPKWSGNLSANYEFTLPFWSLGQYARLDYTYKSEVNWEPGLGPLTESDAYGVLGLTLGVRSSDERYELIGFVKNLTDEFVVSSLWGGNEAIVAGLLPEYQRTWGIMFNYKSL